MAAGLALALAVAAPRAAAQAQFTWPDTAVDVAKYTTLIQCHAAVRRARDVLEMRRDRNPAADTVPPDPRASLKPAPAAVTATAARCSARWAAATADLADWRRLVELFLDANRDADAKALVTRRLAAAKGTPERNAASDTATEIYIAARPVRLDAARELIVARARGGDRIDRIQLYIRYLVAANDAGDSLQNRLAAQWVVAVADSLTQAERESDKWTNLQPIPGDVAVFLAMQQLLGLRTILDSLRQSTQAMVNLERTMWAHFTKQQGSSLPYPIGEKALALTGDFWFPAAAAKTPHPAPGRVSIVEFLSNLCSPTRGDDHRCGQELAQLRRLARRFPDVDITLVARTHGYVLNHAPITPAEEAEDIRKWLEGYGIPGGAAITVSTTPFWNLPEPDGRRINKPTPNDTTYTLRVLNKRWDLGNMNRFLIDQDGIIIDTKFLEEEVPQLIEVLLQRQKEGGARATK